MKDAKAPDLTVSDLKKHVGFWLRFVSNHVSNAFARKLLASGVTVAEWAVMREMFDDEETSPDLLAERIGMTRGDGAAADSATGIPGRTERRGILSSAFNPRARCAAGDHEKTGRGTRPAHTTNRI